MRFRKLTAFVLSVVAAAVLTAVAAPATAHGTCYATTYKSGTYYAGSLDCGLSQHASNKITVRLERKEDPSTTWYIVTTVTGSNTNAAQLTKSLTYNCNGSDDRFSQFRLRVTTVVKNASGETVHSPSALTNYGYTCA